jgi:RimJ/RimL family protein N-acetyltransferase
MAAMGRSVAIPKRLGFQYERTIERAQEVAGRWIDHEVFVLERRV